MPELIEPYSPALPRIDLRLVCDIDKETIDRIDAEINRYYARRLIARGKRFELIPDGPVATHGRRWLPVIGLLLALGYTAYGGISFRGIRLDLWFAGFFALLLPFGWFINMDRTNESRPLYKWLARPYTRPLFRTARKRAPFTAEYEFRGDLVVYFRITGDKSEVVWHNRMYGVSCSGNGYTMLYKNSRSFKPHALFLHHPSAEFNALLEALGITPMPEQAGGP